jgi:hypothetical protein
MKRTLFALTVLLAVCLLAVPGSAQTSKSFLLETGAMGYVDSLLWSNNHGTSTSKICTLKAATDRDTSITFPLANLERMTAFIYWDNKQGTAGGTHAVSCSLLVSMDANQWFSNTLFPVWSIASSTTDGDAALPAVVVYADPSDSTATTVAGVAGRTAQAILKSARFGRLKLKQSSGAADTTLVRITTYRQYAPVTR